MKVNLKDRKTEVGGSLNNIKDYYLFVIITVMKCVV